MKTNSKYKHVKEVNMFTLRDCNLFPPRKLEYARIIRALGDSTLQDVDGTINKFIQSPVSVSVLENGAQDETNINYFYELLESLKLILEMVYDSPEALSVITIENLLQFLRDLYDNINNDACIRISFSILNLVSGICSLSERSENMISLSNFFLYNMHILQQTKNGEGPLIRTQVLCSLLEALVQSKSTTNMKIFSDKSNENNSSVDVTSLLLHLIFESENAVSGFTLLNLMPSYTNVFGSLTIVQSIWNKSIMLNGTNDLKQFTVLCFVYDFLNDQCLDTKEHCVRILEDESFWTVIQYGLTHSENVIRRQALYLMKRSIQELFDRSLTINSCKMNEICGTNFKQKLDSGIIRLTNGMKNFTVNSNKMFLLCYENNSIMWWNSNLKQELTTLFNDVFLILETSEEKQVHIVKPVCNTMIRLIEASLVPFRNGKTLHISWILVLYQRILQHDNIAVVRWALNSLMELDLRIYDDERAMLQIIYLIVNSLNNSILFLNEPEELLNSMNRFFVNVSSTPNIGQGFFQRFIEEMCAKKWSPEPLYLVLQALTNVKLHSLHAKELNVLKEFVRSSITNHYTFMRSAVQCQILTLVINLTDISVVSLDTLEDLFGCFRTDECLQRGCSSWTAVANWIEFCFSKRCAEEYIVENLPYHKNQSKNPSNVCKLVCLLYDAHLFGVMKCCGENPSSRVIAVLNDVVCSFKDADKRLYADSNELTYKLSMLFHILSENLSSDKAEPTHLVEMVLPLAADILSYVICRSRQLTTVDDYDVAKPLIGVVNNILKSHKLYHINSEPFTNSLLQYSIKSLGVLGPPTSSPIEMFVAMNYLQLIIHFVYKEAAVPRLKLLQTYFKANVNNPLPKVDANDQSFMWGRINAEYLAAQWHVISRLRGENLLTVTNKVVVESFFTHEELATHCETALMLGGGTLLLPVMGVLEDVLPEISPTTTECLVDKCWNTVLETRRSELFLPCVRKFIEMLYQSELIRKAMLRPLLLKYSSYLLSESINGIANIFINHVQSLKVKYNPDLIWTEVLSQSSAFATIPQREDRLTVLVCDFISSTSSSANELVANDWNTSSEVRARSIQIILSLVPGTHSPFGDDLVDALLNQELSATGKKTRYFANSSLHLVRTRILQTLLVVEPLISMEKRVFLFNWLCSLLRRESQQPSVRYLTEWLIVRLLWRIPDLKNLVWAHFDEALEQRVGSICSFISIIYHTLHILPDPDLEPWLDRAVTQFLPYCLAQHFSLRLYAQVTLEKMWLIAEQRGVVSILQKYSVVRDCLNRNVGNGNALKNAEKLRQDFYWTIFHPLHHFSLQTVFRDLPRLAHIKADEWITPELFSKVGVKSSSQTVPLSSGDDLWNYPVASWTQRQEEHSAEASCDNFQKKMIPLKSLVPDYQQLLGLSSTSLAKKPVSSDGLIVVASLIEKAANIGGLSRTCEAFGVTELVIDSLQLLEDKQFQSLSVTAEKWIAISEVKSHYLSNYLLRMKQDGYTVVGAEQTSKSLPLHETKLPQKSLLLLGNEKEGIPPTLLPYLDLCIEIPQLGVIRSLNVHVTASIFIWEYAKQHPLASST